MIDAQRERYVSLATFRKDGREVRTPVWIVAGDGKAWIYTDINSAKVKRIRNNGRVRVAPSDIRGKVKGDWVDAMATLVKDPEDRQLRIQALVEKYGWQMRWALFWARLFGRSHERVIIELTF